MKTFVENPVKLRSLAIVSGKPHTACAFVKVKIRRRMLGMKAYSLTSPHGQQWGIFSASAARLKLGLKTPHVPCVPLANCHVSPGKKLGTAEQERYSTELRRHDEIYQDEQRRAAVSF